jgi:hypothetical protein
MAAPDREFLLLAQGALRSDKTDSSFAAVITLVSAVIYSH